LAKTATAKRHVIPDRLTTAPTGLVVVFRKCSLPKTTSNGEITRVLLPTTTVHAKLCVVPDDFPPTVLAKTATAKRQVIPDQLTTAPTWLVVVFRKSALLNSTLNGEITRVLLPTTTVHAKLCVVSYDFPPTVLAKTATAKRQVIPDRLTTAPTGLVVVFRKSALLNSTLRGDLLGNRYFQHSSQATLCPSIEKFVSHHDTPGVTLKIPPAIPTL